MSAGDTTIQRIVSSFQSPQLSLAIDEQMLLTDLQSGAVRTWVPQQPFVVLGRSSPADAEVDFDACRRENIWVGRRVSGGQTIVTGQGCLMYAVMLRYEDHPDLRMLDHAHQFVMSRMQLAVASLGVSTTISGVSDLTLGGKKVSGNSMRCLKDRFLYHGTMICEGFDLSIIPRSLKQPIREPDYRAGRSHEDFLTRLPVDCLSLEQAIHNQWGANEALPTVEHDSLMRDAERLAVEKYATEKWTLKVP